MVERHHNRGDGLLEGFTQHLCARYLLGHGVELVAGEREGIDLAVLQEIEGLVIGLIAGDLRILQMP
jgi:hypothetical protein